MDSGHLSLLRWRDLHYCLLKYKFGNYGDDWKSTVYFHKIGNVQRQWIIVLEPKTRCVALIQFADGDPQCPALGCAGGSQLFLVSVGPQRWCSNLMWKQWAWHAFRHQAWWRSMHALNLCHAHCFRIRLLHHLRSFCWPIPTSYLLPTMYHLLQLPWHSLGQGAKKTQIKWLFLLTPPPATCEQGLKVNKHSYNFSDGPIYWRRAIVFFAVSQTKEQLQCM